MSGTILQRCSLTQAMALISPMVTTASKVVIPLAQAAGSGSTGGWFLFARPPSHGCIPLPFLGFGFGDPNHWSSIDCATNAHQKAMLLAQDILHISSVETIIPDHRRTAHDGRLFVEGGAIMLDGAPGYDEMLFACSAFPGFPDFDEMMCILVAHYLHVISDKRIELIISKSANTPMREHIDRQRMSW